MAELNVDRLEKDVGAWIECRPVAAFLALTSNAGAKLVNAQPPRPLFLET